MTDIIIPIGWINPVPQSVSPRQIRQAMTATPLPANTATTIRAAVESAIAGSGQNMQDWYEYSTEFDRQNPNVIALGNALDVSSDQLDQLWTLAGSL